MRVCGCHYGFVVELYEICELLGSEPKWLQRVLISRQIEDGISAELNAMEASRYKNILCKTLYSRLFTWLINRINDISKVRFAGVLNSRCH